MLWSNQTQLVESQSLDQNKNKAADVPELKKNNVFVATINSWKLTQETLNTTQLFHEVNSTHEEEFTD